MDRDYDVIVVGGGGAGHCAAIAAREGGARVLLIDAADRFGGTTAASGGVFYAGGTSVQKAAGVEDSVEAFFDHYMTFNHWLIEPCIGRRYCEEAGPTIDWLIEQGISYDPKDLYVAGIETTPRGHQPSGQGLGYIETLHNRAASMGVELVHSTRAEALLADSEGRICGVRASGFDLACGAVILACGGLGGNKELLQRYYPDALRAGDWVYYYGVSTNQGDYVALGESVGAVLANSSLNHGIVLRAANFERMPDAFVEPWHMFVNKRGRRFVNELANYAVLGEIIEAQPGSHCFTIFDEDAFAAATGHAPYAGPDKPSWYNPNWANDFLMQMLERGKMHCADTLDALADTIGVHKGALHTNIQRYNQFVCDGCDEQFFKPMQGARPIANGPFYAVEMRASWLVATSCGLQIDIHSRVYDENDKPIPGLYAAGESAGGVSAYYIGGGNSVGPGAVFGRIAGRHAAAVALAEAGKARALA